jgi:PhnB protein
MARMNPYLNFDGNCEAAFKHYKDAFGGEFQMLMRFKDMPPSEQGASTSDRIMHVALPMGGGNVLMGSDLPEEPHPGMAAHVVGNNMSISISTENEDETHRIFNKLAEGGQVTMPVMQTFWSPLFGMCTDKFGVNWMVGMDQPQ